MSLIENLRHLKWELQLWKKRGLLKRIGLKYICPFCGFRSSSLQEFGSNFEANRKYEIVGAGLRKCRCWKCYSTDRERLIYLYLRDYTNFFKKKHKLLHIAPEPNLSKMILAESNNEYVCGDYFMPGYSYPEYVQNMNVLDLNFPEGTFDVVICNHVLEHIDEDLKAMSELYRVLKNGGFAILQVPLALSLEKTLEDSSVVHPEDREKLYGQYDHVRLYGIDYKERLESVGFKVDLHDVSANYPKAGLGQNESIYICTK